MSQKLVKLIANLGYGSRREVARMFREGRITDTAGEVLYADDRVEHALPPPDTARAPSTTIPGRRLRARVELSTARVGPSRVEIGQHHPNGPPQPKRSNPR